MTVVDRTLAAVSKRVQRLLEAERTPQRDGFLQAVDPAIKILGLFALIVVAVSIDTWPAQAVLLVLVAGLTLGSRVSVVTLVRRTAIVPAASFVIVAPQLVWLPGDAVFGPITVEGMSYVLTFVLRVSVSVSLLSLLILTTRVADLLVGFRRLGVPELAISLVAITYRHLQVFFGELSRVVRARRSRTIVDRGAGQTWRETGSMLGSFLLRAFERAERVQRNARARGGTTMAAYPSDSDLGRADGVFVTMVATVVATRIGVWIL